MLLTSLEIKNFRSLEHVKLDGLGQFNVLIGRNNSGKSAVFGTLNYLNETIHSRTPPWGRAITSGDRKRSIEIHLRFIVDAKERDEFVNLLALRSNYVSSERDALMKSPLASQLAFSFSTTIGSPSLMHLRRTEMLASDDKWATIQVLQGDDRVNNPQSQVKDIAAMANHNPSFVSDSLDIKTGSAPSSNLQTNSLAQLQGNEPILWAEAKCAQYLDNIFFFSPYRHSQESLPSQEQPLLAQDGSNLAQVLHTIYSNDRRAFKQIEEFMQSALPDVGVLHSIIGGNQTMIDFQSRDRAYHVPLHDMGGGVEQLLLVATLLSVKGAEATIFLEEPESHLHPGAQRFLFEQLSQSGRQVFTTTHSPVFVNQARPSSLFQVTYKADQTNISPVNDAQSLSLVLGDIGARNSDVLLSDAVLFVEGPSDRDVIMTWSEILEKNFAEQNVTILPMGGGEYALRSAPVRSDVLVGVSQKAPVPHLFLLDRDERSQNEIQKLQLALGNRLSLLQKRELENYLLVPRALLAALRSKYQHDAAVLEKVTQTPENKISQIVSEIAGGLFGLVLLKRIRAEVEGLKGGVFPREIVEKLLPEAENSKLDDLIKKEIQSRISNHLSSIDIEGIVEQQRIFLKKEWTDAHQHLCLAPGQEILEKLFQHFGGQYKKPEDAVRIAREMDADEIDAEVKALIEKVTQLANQRRE